MRLTNFTHPLIPLLPPSHASGVDWKSAWETRQDKTPTLSVQNFHKSFLSTFCTLSFPLFIILSHTPSSPPHPLPASSSYNEEEGSHHHWGSGRTNGHGNRHEAFLPCFPPHGMPCLPLQSTTAPHCHPPSHQTLQLISHPHTCP